MFNIKVVEPGACFHVTHIIVLKQYNTKDYDNIVYQIVSNYTICNGEDIHA